MSRTAWWESKYLDGQFIFSNSRRFLNTFSKESFDNGNQTKTRTYSSSSKQLVCKSWTALHMCGEALKKWLVIYAVLWDELFLRLFCDLPFSFIHVEFVSMLFFRARRRFCYDGTSGFFVCFNSCSSFENMCKWCLKNIVACSPFQAYCVCWSHTLQKNDLFHWWGQFFRKLIYWGILTNLWSNFLVKLFSLYLFKKPCKLEVNVTDWRGNTKVGTKS